MNAHNEQTMDEISERIVEPNNSESVIAVLGALQQFHLNADNENQADFWLV